MSDKKIRENDKERKNSTTRKTAHKLSCECSFFIISSSYWKGRTPLRLRVNRQESKILESGKKKQRHDFLPELFTLLSRVLISELFPPAEIIVVFLKIIIPHIQWHRSKNLDFGPCQIYSRDIIASAAKECFPWVLFRGVSPNFLLLNVEPATCTELLLRLSRDAIDPFPL